MKQTGLNRKAKGIAQQFAVQADLVHAPGQLNSNDARAQKGFASFGTVMKDASGFQTQQMLYVIPQNSSTGTRFAGPPVLRN